MSSHESKSFGGLESVNCEKKHQLKIKHEDQGKPICHKNGPFEDVIHEDETVDEPCERVEGHHETIKDETVLCLTNLTAMNLAYNSTVNLENLSSLTKLEHVCQQGKNVLGRTNYFSSQAWCEKFLTFH